MLLSTQKNFIFIHVPKTAGSSIHRTLTPFAVGKNRTLLRRLSNKLPILEKGENAYFRIHQKAREVQRKIGAAAFGEMETIACVRNPFDHAVSHYEYLKVAPNRYLNKKIQKISFEEYLKARLTSPNRGRARFLHLPAMSDYLCDDNGAIIVKHILRFENLSAEFDALLGQLSIDRKALPHTNKRHKARPSLAEYYDATTIELVRDIYRPDFVNFGYDMDMPS